MLLGAKVSHASGRGGDRQVGNGMGAWLVNLASTQLPGQTIFNIIESLLRGARTTHILDPQGNGVSSRVEGDDDMLMITYSEGGDYTVYIQRDGHIEGHLPR
ncbi:MAG: hypothetical protein LBB37_04605 [Endomicrobium sp.]|nr:hypothetical protein [Endomicrobium sp.]